MLFSKRTETCQFLRFFYLKRCLRLSNFLREISDLLVQNQPCCSAGFRHEHVTADTHFIWVTGMRSSTLNMAAVTLSMSSLAIFVIFSTHFGQGDYLLDRPRFLGLTMICVDILKHWERRFYFSMVCVFSLFKHAASDNHYSSTVIKHFRLQTPIWRSVTALSSDF